jgi:apolipoprotein D and lipocalin family protein
MNPSLRITSAAAAMAFLASSCSQPPLDVAPDVDLARFQGRWYEIAKLPRPWQEGCTQTTATYQLRSDREMYMQNQCLLSNGTTRNVVARGAVTNAAVPAKLSVDFGGFYGDY